MRNQYSTEPIDGKEHTLHFDAVYSRFATAYDAFVKIWPGWRRWLEETLPHIEGPRVLEVSFGTGYLLTRYAERFETYGIDHNFRLTTVARRNLARSGVPARLQLADVAALPYRNEYFDCLVNTMAFSGYPDGGRAMAEMNRVLRPGGKLIMIDVNYPLRPRWFGRWMTRGWALAGDLIRNIDDLFTAGGFRYTAREIGGLGSVHLYVAEKHASPARGNDGRAGQASSSKIASSSR